MSRAWTLQLVLALASLPWLAVYALAFRRSLAGASRWRDVLYNLGVLANVTWLVMIVAPQPRFPGVFDPARVLVTPLSLVPLLLGLALVVRFGRANVRTMAANARAVQRCYGQPTELLTEGPYAEVRNPMNTGGMLVFLGLGLLAGAAFTVLLFPLYVLVNDVFTVIEERLALKPTFGAHFTAYAAAVPRYFRARHYAVLALVGLVVAGQWALCAPR